MTQARQMLVEAAKSVEGNHRVFIGAYMSDEEGNVAVIAGEKMKLAFLAASIIIQGAVVCEVSPREFMSIVKSAYRFQMREFKKGTPVAEVYQIDGRVEKD